MDWAQGSGAALQGFRDMLADPSPESAQGTGLGLAGQHDVNPQERAAFNRDLDAYKSQHPGATPEMIAAFRIGQTEADDGLLWSKDDRAKYLEAAQQQPLGDVDDPAARLKALSFMTQQTPDKGDGKAHDIDNHLCGGASIVGAAYLAKGPEGLKQVIASLEKQNHDLTSDKNASPEYKALKDKLAKDPASLTVADIQALQQTTYEVLNSSQEKDPDLKDQLEQAKSTSSDGLVGIHSKTMDHFMEKSPELTKMLKDSGMQIEGVDTDGNVDEHGRTAMDHWVVRMKGPDGKDAIYDPNARRGGQVIAFDEGVDTYTKARKDVVGD